MYCNLHMAIFFK